MKRTTLIFIFSLILISCEKNPSAPNDEYDLQETGKIKTKYIYSSSSEIEPYAINSYFYDSNWNLADMNIISSVQDNRS